MYFLHELEAKLSCQSSHNQSWVDFHQFHMVFYQFQQARNEEYQSLKKWSSAGSDTVARQVKEEQTRIFAMIAKNFARIAKFSLGLRNFRYASENSLHSKNGCPVFLIFLIPNDHVLINYHFVPIVISYFRHFCHFTHLGWLYKPPYKFVTLTLIFQYTRNFCSNFLSSLSSFSHFLRVPNTVQG